MIKRQRPPYAAIAIVALMAFLAVFGFLIAPHPANVGSLSHRLMPPSLSSGYLFGTDWLGRDILSRLIVGARVSFTVAVLSIVVGGALGTVLGIISGYYGRWIDKVIMSLTNLTMALPLLIIAMVLAVVRGPSYWNVIIVISLLLWSRYARQVRGEILSLKEKEYVAAAKVAGASTSWIMARHMFPNVVNTLIVLATLQTGWTIIVESSLSFLGAGVPPPDPSWGTMVSEGRSMIDNAWWISVVPGAAILLVVLSMNILGDYIRDRLDPRLRNI